MHIYNIFFTALYLLFVGNASGQITITGAVYDSTNITPVNNVKIYSSSGTTTVTDSLGRYAIVTSDKDSLTFFYKNKPTMKFPVKQIPDIGRFDISLHILVPVKYKILKEVKIYGKNFQQDSIENRERYAKLFKYQQPGISINSSNYSGAVGMDLDELINIFRFKRNKQMRKMQERLLEQEKENYINYRFNKTTVKRITRLDGEQLEKFMQEYRPDFEFTRDSTIIEFYQYILNASYQFKKENLQQ